MATLCGVKVSLLFSDLIDSFHYFSNEPDARIEIDPKLTKGKKDPRNLYTYNLDDYPFDVSLDGQNKDARLEEKLNEGFRASDYLGKRQSLPEFRLELLRLQNPGAEDLQPSNNTSSQKLNIPSFLCIPTSEKKVMEGPPKTQPVSQPEEPTAQSSNPYKFLDQEQMKAVEFFMKELDLMTEETLSRNVKDPRRDEDLILLSMLRHFVLRYFDQNPDSGLEMNVISRTMRAKISVGEMIMMLSSIKFKDKNSDMILVTMKQFIDIFLELIINPANFKSNSINFYRGGKSIVNIFVFMLKNYFQQVRIIKSLYCEDFMNSEVVHLFPSETSVDMLKGLVGMTLELASVDQQPAFSSSNIPNSAFQLHSNRQSQEMNPPVEPLESEQQGGNNLLLSNPLLNNSLIVKSNNLSKSQRRGERDQFSFELGRDFLGASAKISPSKEETRYQPPEVLGGMNLFVSSLLKKSGTNREDKAAWEHPKPK